MTGAVGLLFTYAGVNAATLARADQAERLGVPVVWDSGAWSVHTRGAHVDPREHAAWVAKRQANGSTARYIALDIIGDHDGTARQHAKQQALGAIVEPTIHYGASIDHLDAFDVRTEWVNIGGLAGMTRGHAPIRARGWAEPIVDKARASGARVHGLGATHPILTKRIAWSGVDSTFWMSAARFGLLPLFDDKTGGWRRIHYRTRTRSTRAKGWRAMYENGRWLRDVYAITPDELDRASNDRVRDLSVESHRRYAQHLARRHQQAVIVYLAGGNGVPVDVIEALAA